jgi:hypothetical protein
MVARDPNLHLERDPSASDEGDEEGFDFGLLKERAHFVLNSARRRPKLAIFTFVVIAALGLTVSLTMPRTYNSQVKLLAQVDLVLPALSNPNRAVPRDAENPTKNVADQILRRDNIVALIKSLNLVEKYYASRPWPLRLKDKLLAGKMSPDDKLHVMVGTLEKNLTVTVLENNVTVQVDWPDPQMAYDLVTLVQKNFLEARYDDEVAMISDAIGFLQERTKTRAHELDVALEDYQERRNEYEKELAESRPSNSTQEHSPSLAGAARGPRPRAVVDRSAAPAADVADLATSLEDTRRQIRALEEERQRELDALRSQLDQAQLTLTPQHPTVIALQQRIDALSGPDAQLKQLKAAERALVAQMAPPSLAPAASSSSPRPTSVQDQPASDGALLATSAAVLLPPANWGEDARSQIVRSKLEGALRSYQDAIGRLDVANTELEILQVPLHRGHPSGAANFPQESDRDNGRRRLGNRRGAPCLLVRRGYGFLVRSGPRGVAGAAPAEARDSRRIPSPASSTSKTRDGLGLQPAAERRPRGHCAGDPKRMGGRSPSEAVAGDAAPRVAIARRDWRRREGGDAQGQRDAGSDRVGVPRATLVRLRPPRSQPAPCRLPDARGADTGGGRRACPSCAPFDVGESHGDSSRAPGGRRCLVHRPRENPLR